MKQVFFQVTPEDISYKGQEFVKRFSDYLNFGDEIYIYWTDKLFSSKLVARIIRKNQTQSLKLQVLEQEGYNQFKELSGESW